MGVLTFLSKSILFRLFLQVVKPVNLEALSKWVGHIPPDVLEDMGEIAPMLEHFGYDPKANPPLYGKPDVEAVKNTNDVIMNESKWEEAGEIVKKISKIGRDGHPWISETRFSWKQLC